MTYVLMLSFGGVGSGWPASKPVDKEINRRFQTTKTLEQKYGLRKSTQWHSVSLAVNITDAVLARSLFVKKSPAEIILNASKGIQPSRKDRLAGESLSLEIKILGTIELDLAFHLTSPSRHLFGLTGSSSSRSLPLVTRR